jgi:Protein of unknown function (DUF4085)
MIFFTRELFEGTQPQSGWERRAMRETERRGKIYGKYFDVIAPLLPPAVVRLCKTGLHDGVIQEASLKNHELVLVVDTTNALSGFRDSLVTLTFRGVRGHPVPSKLVGEWWLYEEAHLSSNAPFSLHVMFNKLDLEIEAETLVIKLSSVGRRRTKRST